MIARRVVVQPRFQAAAACNHRVDLDLVERAAGWIRLPDVVAKLAACDAPDTRDAIEEFTELFERDRRVAEIAIPSAGFERARQRPVPPPPRGGVRSRPAGSPG